MGFQTLLVYNFLSLFTRDKRLIKRKRKENKNKIVTRNFQLYTLERSRFPKTLKKKTKQKQNSDKKICTCSIWESRLSFSYIFLSLFTTTPREIRDLFNRKKKNKNKNNIVTRNFRPSYSKSCFIKQERNILCFL